VSLHLFDIANQKIVDLGKYNDFLCLNAMDKDPNVPSAQVLNRQDNLDLLLLMGILVKQLLL
jgi:hypothetical protein